MFTLGATSEATIQEAQGTKLPVVLMAGAVSRREPRGELRDAELSALTIEYPYSIG